MTSRPAGAAAGAPGTVPRLAGWWRRADSARNGFALDLGLYGLSAAFAGITAASSTLAPHRAWGAIAVWGYAAAALITLIMHRRVAPRAASGKQLMIVWWRAALTGLTWVAVALVPLVSEAVQRVQGRPDRAQEEVAVIEWAGQRLYDTGTPYLARSAIATLPEAERLLGYLPYQPGMALFGLPRAILGEAWWTDARVWFAVATAATLGTAVAVLRAAPAAPLLRAVQAATVLPLGALTLATGGDDLPVLTLCLLALAFAARGRMGTAGLAVGAAGALKLFAWPVTVVLAALASRRGRPARFLLGAVGLPVLALVPAALLADPGALVENVIRYPLGRGLVTSPAQSPFPGHLIAAGLPNGRGIAFTMITAAGVAIAVGFLRRPPRTAAAASLWAGYGLLVAILLMPSTRFGYLLYPVAFLVWSPALREDTAAGPGPAAYTYGMRRTYRDRATAGEELAAALAGSADGGQTVVLGLVRGGVPVAATVAARLHAPLDVLVVRKLGVPWAPELAFGALGPDGVYVLNDDIARRLGRAEIEAVVRQETAELERRERRYRADRPPLDLAGRTAVIVDDGLATGATARTAVVVARRLGATRVVVAAPVGSREAVELLRTEADQLICPVVPRAFGSVSRYYADFRQVDDDAVGKLLRGSRP